jgi:hypothetical protein
MQIKNAYCVQKKPFYKCNTHIEIDNINKALLLNKAHYALNAFSRFNTLISKTIASNDTRNTHIQINNTRIGIENINKALLLNKGHYAYFEQ